MRILKSGLIVAFLLLVPYFQLNAQNCSSARYIDRVFDSVTVTTDVIYANAPSVTTPYVAENVTINIDLKLDVFEPTGDTLNKRPLVILAFGGGFLIGAKEDEDIRATCDSLARLGYVTASIDYRLGMNILVTTSAERAVYRAIQDYSAAVRYFKEFATTYSIDTNYIFIGGVSAGAITSLHLAFAEESDRPVSTFSSSFPNPAPDLGCRDCSGNSYNHSSTNVKAVINCWGAMGDVNWIEPGEDVPIISFHGDQDAIVPYDSGYPFTAMTTMPYVYGSLPISQHADSIGLYNEFYPFPGEGHNVWGTVVNNLFVGGPTGYFQPILHSISDFLFLFIKPNTDSITGDGMVCLNDTSTYSVNNTTGSFYCWTVNGGTIVSTDSTQNTIDVMWNTTGQNNIIVREINKFQAIGDTQSFSVMINPLPTISVANDLSICVGDTVTIFGGGASTYLWSPATALEDPAADTTKAYPTTSTTYTLTGSDSNNCKAEDSMAITVNSLPNVSVTND
ncbi:MAG TPA: alpha/beta hydrolase, partial [Flavobacteriales bacterium]|nr:alpha/beta hydrolase [Flavobacteriales bacterium]